MKSQEKFKVGDTVRITRKPTKGEYASWYKEMNKAIGKSGKISLMDDNRNCYVKIRSLPMTFCYPACVLEKVKEGSSEPESFQVGDIVEVIKSAHSELIGQHCNVIQIGCFDSSVRIKYAGLGFWEDPSHLKFISRPEKKGEDTPEEPASTKFEAGDKVKILRCSGDPSLVGKIREVVYASSYSTLVTIRVKLENGRTVHWSLSARDIELVERKKSGAQKVSGDEWKSSLPEQRDPILDYIDNKIATMGYHDDC